MRKIGNLTKNIKINNLYSYRFCSQNKEEPDMELFSKIDIRVGKILQCWKHPQSENLYCQKIQIANEPLIIREIGSGLQKFVPIEKMSGNVLVLVNLKSRKLAGFASEGMILCAAKDHEGSSDCWPLFVEGEVGERAYLQGYQDLFYGGETQKPLNSKKKILEKCLPFLQTNEEGLVQWNKIPLKLSTGYIKSELINSAIR